MAQPSNNCSEVLVSNPKLTVRLKITQSALPHTRHILMVLKMLSQLIKVSDENSFLVEVLKLNIAKGSRFK